STTSTSTISGCRNLGEALRRVREGAAMIQTKGDAGTRNIIEVLGRLSVVHFVAGRVTTPENAALMMQLGCDRVFVQAVTHYRNPDVLAELN
ncbi:hypothetical protein GBA52_026128, partial [Prunus armeniaca]